MGSRRVERRKRELVIATPRWLEKRWGYRWGLHFFGWGVHRKVRYPARRGKGPVWHHLVVKIQARGSAFGVDGARGSLWIAWWRSREGKTGWLNGRRFTLASERLPKRPPDGSKIPFFPQHERHAKRMARKERRQQEKEAA